MKAIYLWERHKVTEKDVKVEHASREPTGGENH